MPLQLDLKHSKWKMLQLDAVTIYYKGLTKDKLLAKIPNTSTNKDSPGLTEREYKLKKKKTTSTELLVGGYFFTYLLAGRLG